MNNVILLKVFPLPGGIGVKLLLKRKNKIDY